MVFSFKVSQTTFIRKNTNQATDSMWILCYPFQYKTSRTWCDCWFFVKLKLDIWLPFFR